MSALPALASDGRSTLYAVNQNDVLKEALIRELRALGFLYAVGKRRPITELPPEHQEKIRQAYADTLWSTGDSVELMGIFTSETLANRICKERGGNWFCTKLPIDSLLCDELVAGEWASKFPGSDAHELYENLQSTTVPIPATQLRMLEEEAERLLEIIKVARGSLAKSP